ncbi:MAG: hypothetical protein CGU29_16650 [Candidatus Dactylopiibacterium carminicum]|uniref:MSHA biogenesis protein MshD n=1 Tax=Candidatus Dactylopiibacterium carminicum TaxID=857335 RepID=A0A272EMR2_9RHOO|nr:prepilin-type N-terminal cleavage/methylation domain-containing protein [Candidatus Dactylopiibacterium carminicum]KAF7597828.1 hypothetical protein BGI27_16650 [Candidatus Dactylopiibacterium carminicum]PAS91399.1 MAG: hypothetical protein CGU29_16650 [Candidatus Dactylopiibacterium carminicum]PAS95654.1 MAG: hypothetical protein BSR46_16680 [Candidatus Dactylopiibacterium carminicum]
MCIERSCQQGLTFVELVVFIVIVAVSLAGILNVLDFSVRHGADPMLFKQQVSIAESLLEEVASKPFTWCDPDDPVVTSAGGTAACGVAQGLAPTAGESRNSGTSPFDNVGDYSGFSMTGIQAPDGTAIDGLAAYTATVAIAQAGAAFGLADASAALRIDVTVTTPGQAAITLTGYRMRYAQNAP